MRRFRDTGRKKFFGVPAAAIRERRSAVLRKRALVPASKGEAGRRQRNCCPATAWGDPKKSFFRPVR